MRRLFGICFIVLSWGWSVDLAPAQDGCITPNDLSNLQFAVPPGLIPRFFNAGMMAPSQGINVSQSDLNFSEVLSESCSRLISFSGLSPQEYRSAVDSGLVLNLLLGLARARDVAGLVSTEGPDRQIVEPRAALSEFGFSPGASDWRASVESEYAEVKDGKSLCQLAIDELKGVACGSTEDRSCNIEQSYRDRCVNTNDKAKQGACIVAADNYFAHCFGRWSPANEFVYRGLVPVCEDATTYCSSSVASVSNRLLVLTAHHCASPSGGLELEEEGGFCTDRSLGNDRWSRDDADLMMIETFAEAPVFYPPGEARALRVDTTRGIEEFAATAVGGFNSLAKARNLAVAGYNSNLDSPPPNLPSRFYGRGELIWDESALCTIVEADDRELKHTCQTASGGSGGPIVLTGESPRLVAVHRGAPEKTSGAFNFGTPLGRLDELINR